MAAKKGAKVVSKAAHRDGAGATHVLRVRYVRTMKGAWGQRARMGRI